MKLSFLLLLSTILLFSSVLHAQPPQGGEHPTPEAMAARSTEELTRELGLSAKQVPKVKVVQLAFFQKTTKAMEAAGQGNRPAKETMDAFHAEQEAGLKAILTADQFKKFKVLAEKMKSEHGQHGHQGPPPPPRN